MGRPTLRTLAVATALLATSSLISAQGRIRDGAIPTREGTCTYSRIREVSHRLQDGRTGRVIPDSGSAVVMTNGLYQVSYSEVAAVNESRRGDRVFVCLIKIPRGCPPGDNRGRLYTTTNLRTEDSWTLFDSQHMCGGA